jgi:hypothetical protein
MIVYIAIVNDRHADPEARPFSTAEAAITYARAAARENARRPDDVEEHPIDGWLYYARYSVEGDNVWVVAQELDQL